LRKTLKKRGTKPVSPNKRNRKQPFSFNKKAYKGRHLIENAFCRLKDFRRIATRYGRLAINFAASIYLVGAVPSVSMTMRHGPPGNLHLRA